MDSISNPPTTLLIEESVWIGSDTLSAANHTGCVSIEGHRYYLMHPSNDLVWSALVLYYQFLGRDRFIEALLDAPNDPKSKVDAIMSAYNHNQSSHV